MATPANAASYIRLKTRTNSTTFTDADMLVLWNWKKNEVCQRALETDEDIFEIPAYASLEADQRTYPLHADILSRISRVEAKLDGTNWLKLKEVDLQEIDTPITLEADITYNFSNEEGCAFYDISRKSLVIYSGTITSVTDGLRVWHNIWPADVSSMAGTSDMSEDPSTTTHGVPKELHKVISVGVIIEWKESREKPIPLNESEQKWEYDLEKAIQTLKKANYDREVTGAIPCGTYDMEDEDGSNL